MASLSTAGQVETLRLELKTWEANFAASHDGRKPSREDIKQDVDIGKSSDNAILHCNSCFTNAAIKYKAYANVKGPIAASPGKSKSCDRSTVKRSKSLQGAQKDGGGGDDGDGAPLKRPWTSLKSSSRHPADNESRLFDIPPSPEFTPKRRRTCIGPTPQKDGIVLGLFDLLSPSSAEKVRSSRTRSNARKVLGELDSNREGKTIQTPSKRKRGAFDEENQVLSVPTPLSDFVRKSPMSKSKRARSDSFLTTPSKRRALDVHITPSRSGASLMRLGEETPSYLRRINSRGVPSGDQVADGDASEKPDDISWSPVRPRPRAFGCTLSALMQGLRQIEDEKADEDLDLLRELEGDGTVPPPRPKPFMKPTLLVQDSQATEAPLGPDREIFSDEESMGTDVEGKPARKWKKKGQKRTTRKVNIKPATAKWKPEPRWEAPRNDEAYNLDENALEDSIMDGAQVVTAHIGHGSTDSGATADEQGQQVSKTSRIRAMIEKTKAAIVTEADGKKKSKIKVGALAHMNFRSLNIKNKNSKGKGRGGKFGRRR